MIELARIELGELLRVDEPTGAQLRRIAELMELLHDREAARPWWARAAAAGDRDAVDMALLLIEEGWDG